MRPVLPVLPPVSTINTRVRLEPTHWRGLRTARCVPRGLRALRFRWLQWRVPMVSSRCLGPRRAPIVRRGSTVPIRRLHMCYLVRLGLIRASSKHPALCVRPVQPVRRELPRRPAHRQRHTRPKDPTSALHVPAVSAAQVELPLHATSVNTRRLEKTLALNVPPAAIAPSPLLLPSSVLQAPTRPHHKWHAHLAHSGCTPPKEKAMHVYYVPPVHTALHLTSVHASVLRELTPQPTPSNASLVLQATIAALAVFRPQKLYVPSAIIAMLSQGWAMAAMASTPVPQARSEARLELRPRAIAHNAPPASTAQKVLVTSLRTPVRQVMCAP